MLTIYTYTLTKTSQSSFHIGYNLYIFGQEASESRVWGEAPVFPSQEEGELVVYTWHNHMCICKGVSHHLEGNILFLRSHVSCSFHRTSAQHIFLDNKWLLCHKALLALLLSHHAKNIQSLVYESQFILIFVCTPIYSVSMKKYIFKILSIVQELLILIITVYWL